MKVQFFFSVFTWCSLFLGSGLGFPTSLQTFFCCFLVLSVSLNVLAEQSVLEYVPVRDKWCVSFPLLYLLMSCKMLRFFFFYLSTVQRTHLQD